MSNNFTIKCGPQQMKLIEEHCFSETEVEVDTLTAEDTDFFILSEII